ncbi:uncharacterized protein LOC142355854 [Convolutriloba macropyga]|uniref:uncharacterized protein LOC142355854 n=1 Tax=Convolutriloba macropyga TaxID=536237 RepID=UPI003F51CF95
MADTSLRDPPPLVVTTQRPKLTAPRHLTGVGSCLLAGVYEAGRPDRLNAEEAQELQEQWSDFVSFAEERLLRTGRCHETEIYSAFRKSNAKYRDPATIPDRTLRDMIRQWFPASQRTSTGYYKNVSVIPRADPFQ